MTTRASAVGDSQGCSTRKVVITQARYETPTSRRSSQAEPELVQAAEARRQKNGQIGADEARAEGNREQLGVVQQREGRDSG
jgi:hypothetical protein